MNKRSAWMVLGGLAAATAGTGCVVDNDNPDYLSVNSWIVADDGVSQVTNLRLDYYDWMIQYDDGTYMLERFSGPALVSGFSDDAVTPHTGNLTFTSQNLWLASGSPSITCNEFCTERDFDGYCLEWTRDCYDSSLTMDVTDIVSSSAAISYRVGSSFLTTVGERSTEFTGPVSATTWAQSDVFVTPFRADFAQEVSGPGKKKAVDAGRYAEAMPSSAAPARSARHVQSADIANDPKKRAILDTARKHLIKKSAE